MTATVEPATVEPAAVVFVAVVSFTVESAEAFGAESIPVEGRVAVTVRIRVIAVAVRGIAVASVIPRSVSTSRQAEGRKIRQPSRPDADSEVSGVISAREFGQREDSLLIRYLSS
jgi:hypothetical protein